MCGIIGISSNKSVSSSIINSLKKLEYRGYDSAGIATLSGGFINEVKSEGRVENLENNFDLKNLSGNIGIGHVRWATHGVPNSINAHPHSSETVSVVHNGIIENSTLLKKYLLNKGHKFKSQTDTEVIVHLITENLKTSELQDAITKTLKQLHGSFALGIIFKDMPDLIIGARRGSPLAVGYGPNENYLGSDSYALKSMTNKITYLEDGEFCFIKKDEVNFFNEEGIKINKKVLELSTEQQNYDKGDFKHFMAKEIEEQPITLKNGIKEYIDTANNDINKSIQAASVIQNAILPRIDLSHYGFRDLEYVWQPRDTIGGDFYWLEKKNGWTCLVVADCTGHGIPGAFMTLISSTLLDRISSIKDLSQPDAILNDLDEFLQKSLSLDETHQQTDFGLDAGVCCFSLDEKIFRYSGAKMNLYQKSAQGVVEIKGDKKSLGYDIKQHPLNFKVFECELNQQSSSFFVFSDGVTDQVGGEKKLMYGKKRVLHQISEAVDVKTAVSNIVADVERYQGLNKRRDDLTLFGFAV